MGARNTARLEKAMQVFYKQKNSQGNWIVGIASQLPQDAIKITEKAYLKFLSDELEAMNAWGKEYEQQEKVIKDSASAKLMALGLSEEEIKLIIK